MRSRRSFRCTDYFVAHDGDITMQKNKKETIPLRQIILDPLPDFPLVSVLISNYNYGPYLSDAIESVLCQTYTNLEVIICDDGSTDASHRILERYHSLDPRTKPIYQRNRGQSLALNAAFRESAGEILCLLDADDTFLPDKVQRVVHALTVAPSGGFAVNRMLLVDKAGKYLGEIPSLYDLPSGWQGVFLSPSGPQILPGLPPTSGLSLRRPVAETIFPLPEGLKAYSDTLIQVIAPMVTPVVALDTPLSRYRVHGANIGGVRRFTERHLRHIVSYERQIWMAWRRYLASPRSGLPPDFPLPTAMGPSPMEYAYERLRSGRHSADVYRAISRPYLQALPKPHQLYWRASVILPGWLFRSSFNFVYGQTRSKVIVRKILLACRNRSWLDKWISGHNVAGREAPRRLSSAISTGNLAQGLESSSSGPIAMLTGIRSTLSVTDRTSFEVMGVRVSAVQIPDVVTRMEEWIRRGGVCHSIAPTSMHGIVEAQRDHAFKEILNSTDLVVPDGMSLVWIGRNRRHVLPQRVYGPDLLVAFCEKTDSRGYRHFFYGGQPGVARRLAESLKRRFPGMQIAGTFSPPFRPLSVKEDEEIVAMIERTRPDVVWVGLGAPKQERWMHEHRNRLRVPVLAGVGAAFDLLCGRRRQAPRWMREYGVEWLFRLLQEPRRLWRRYLLYGGQFITYLVLHKLGLKDFESTA
jgi:N-acetylglucosaminyldiphosphoundecaprenol N-acetyl-beta-D-mannosaminyltransferase